MGRSRTTYIAKAAKVSSKAKLEEAVLAWWRSHRPLSYSISEHRANPTVNTCTQAEADLAVEAAKLHAKRIDKDGYQRRKR